MNPLLGSWRNVDPDPDSLQRLLVSAAGERLSLQAWGAGPDGTCDLGTVDALLYEDDDTVPEPNGLTAELDLGFQTIFVAGYVKRGVLCISAFTTFAPGDGRSPYYTREFFHRAGTG